jgi:hypothetical protein
MCDAFETRMNRGGDFLTMNKRDHFVESLKATRAGLRVAASGLKNAFENRHSSWRR